MDDLMFSSPAWLAPPPQHGINGPLLLALSDAAYVDLLRAEVVAAQAEVAAYCPWYDALCAGAESDPVARLMAAVDDLSRARP